MSEHTCYINAWVREQEGKLVFEEAGLYSEGPETITYHLLTEVPVTVLSFPGSSYAAAKDFAIDYIKNYRCPNSVIGRVLKMALAEEERRSGPKEDGSIYLIVRANERLRQENEELKKKIDRINRAMQLRDL